MKLFSQKQKRWFQKTNKVLGVLFGLSLVIGLGAAVASISSPSRLTIAAKSGCGIVKTQDGPGCWCSDGDWQWHCGASDCSAQERKRCEAENGTQKEPESSAPATRCKLGEWSCKEACADASVQKIFNDTWANGKAQWLYEAGCSTSPSAKKTAAIAQPTARPVNKPISTCSSTDSGVPCRGKTVGSKVSLPNGTSCYCAITSGSACSCQDKPVATPTRVSRGLQRETRSPALKQGSGPTPTRRADWSRDANVPTVTRTPAKSNAVVTCPSRPFDNACNHLMVNSSCADFVGLRTKVRVLGTCRYISGFSGCDCVPNK